MLDRFFEFLDRFETGFNPIDWWWVPRFFKHKEVMWKDGQRADETGMFWLNLRFSFYHNIVTWKELWEKRNGINNE